MKSLIIALAIFLIAFNSNAGIFSPSSYEECLLENLKNAKNPEAVDTMKNACALKFPPKPPETKKPAGLKVCKIYWDGWRLIKGEIKHPDYIKVTISYHGADSLEMSIPKSMGKNFDIEKELNKDEIDYKTKWGIFFSKNIQNIISICEFNQ